MLLVFYLVTGGRRAACFYRCLVVRMWLLSCLCLLMDSRAMFVILVQLATFSGGTHIRENRFALKVVLWCGLGLLLVRVVMYRSFIRLSMGTVVCQPCVG